MAVAPREDTGVVQGPGLPEKGRHVYVCMCVCVYVCMHAYISIHIHAV